jgi:hypothetical protein
MTGLLLDWLLEVRGIGDKTLVMTMVPGRIRVLGDLTVSRTLN